MTIETQCCPLCGLMKGECNHNQLGERPDAAPPKTADQIRQGLREADRCPFCHVDELHWPGLRTALDDSHPEDAPEGPREKIVEAAKIHMSALEGLLTGYRFQKPPLQMDALIDAVTNSRDEWRDALNRDVRDKGDKK